VPDRVAGAHVAAVLGNFLLSHGPAAAQPVASTPTAPVDQQGDHHDGTERNPDGDPELHPRT
jgi:hypothetical protein